MTILRPRSVFHRLKWLFFDVTFQRLGAKIAVDFAKESCSYERFFFSVIAECTFNTLVATSKDLGITVVSVCRTQRKRPFSHQNLRATISEPCCSKKYQVKAFSSLSSHQVKLINTAKTRFSAIFPAKNGERRYQSTETVNFIKSRAVRFYHPIKRNWQPCRNPKQSILSFRFDAFPAKMTAFALDFGQVVKFDCD